MATPKECHALVTYFSKKYKEKYGIAPKVNRYSARWGFDSILMDMKSDEIMTIVDFYFETFNQSGHSLEWFFYNYDKLASAKEDRDKDAAELAVIRERTRKRTEEWRKKRSGNN